MPISKEETQTVIQLYNNGQSINAIEKSENISRPTIRKILRKANIRQVYKKDTDHSDTINKYFFENIDTEEKAYFLGLLYADGNVYIESKKRKHYSISINLIEQDKYILEKLRDLVAPNHKLYFVNKKRKNNNQNNQYKLLFNSKEMCQTLINNGCGPKKSLILEFPNHIRHNLLHHFIRGYFDGDGGICKYDTDRITKNYTLYNAHFTSTKNFLIELKKIIQSILNTSCSIYTRKNGITSGITIGGNRQVYRLLSWLYQDATIFLKRKHDKFLELETQIKQKAETIKISAL